MLCNTEMIFWFIYSFMDKFINTSSIQVSCRLLHIKVSLRVRDWHILTLTTPLHHPDATKAESPKVITVILPDQRHQVLLPLGYILTTFLLLVVIVLVVVLITRRHKKKGSWEAERQTRETLVSLMLIFTLKCPFSEFYPQESVRWVRYDTGTRSVTVNIWSVCALWQLQQRSLPLRRVGNGRGRSECVQLGGQKLGWALYRRVKGWLEELVKLPFVCFRLQEQPAKRKGSHESTAQSHWPG